MSVVTITIRLLLWPPHLVRNLGTEGPMLLLLTSGHLNRAGNKHMGLLYTWGTRGLKVLLFFCPQSPLVISLVGDLGLPVSWLAYRVYSL